jgi:uncharacterized protein
LFPYFFEIPTNFATLSLSLSISNSRFSILQFSMSASPAFERLSLPVTDKLGSVTVEICHPESIKAVVTLGHGAGSNLDQPFLKQIATALASHGICSIRFNFIYTEHRKKMPDRFPTAAAVIKGVIHFAASRFPGVPVFCAGKSFGGRMSSMTVAAEEFPDVKGIVFFGFPLHPAGSPSVERASHLEEITVPMLFLHGTKDALANPELLRPVINKLAHATLIEFEGADHSFKGGKQASVTNLAAEAATWINKYT